MSPTEATLTQKLVSFGVFAVGNIGLNLFNSWALKASPTNFPGHGKGDFTFSFFYTMFHMASSCLAALIMQMTCTKPKDGSLPSLSQFWSYKHVLVPISFLTVFNNGFNNGSLTEVALYVNQVIKAVGPLPTCFFEWMFLGKLYNLAIYISVVVLVAGCVLSQAKSFISGGSSQMGGIIKVVISLIAAALKPVVQKLIMTGGDALNPCGGSCGSCCVPKKDASKPSQAALSPSQTLFWDCGLAFWIFLVWTLVNGEFQAACQYLQNGYKGNDQSALLGWAIIAFGSFMAFIFNIALYYFVLYTSALTLNITANGIRIFLILLSVFTEGKDQPPLTWIGIGIVCLSIPAYALLAHQFKNEQAAAAAKDAPPPKDENTPLTQVVSSK